MSRGLGPREDVCIFAVLPTIVGYPSLHHSPVLQSLGSSIGMFEIRRLTVRFVDLAPSSRNLRKHEASSSLGAEVLANP